MTRLVVLIVSFIVSIEHRITHNSKYLQHDVMKKYENAHRIMLPYGRGVVRQPNYINILCFEDI